MQPVAEDVYIFCVDLFLYTFVSSYKGRQKRPRLDCLVVLGASKGKRRCGGWITFA